MFKSLIAPFTSLAGQVLKTRAEKSEAKHKLEMAVLENKARLASAVSEHNSEWELANLQDKDKWLRWFSYSMFTAPIVITVISPEWGRQIFVNLEYAPSWVVEVWIAMNGAVWGLSSLKNVVPSVVGQIRGKK